MDGMTPLGPDWEELAAVFRLSDEELHVSAKLGEARLWLDFAHRRPGEVVVQRADWAKGVGLDRGVVRHWIKKLVRWTLIDVLERFRGGLKLYVYQPLPTWREDDDPQMLLDFTDESEEEMGPAPHSPTIGTNEGRSLLPEYQRTGWSKEYHGRRGHDRDRGPVSIGECVPEVINRQAKAIAEYETVCSGTDQHKRRVESILARVNVDAWFASYVATQIGSGRIREKDVAQIFTDLRLMKRVDNPGGFFRFKLRKLHGWVEPRRRLAPGHE